MKKPPPTLADACLASALDKRVYPGSNFVTQKLKEILLKVPSARKFMLDAPMSRYLGEINDGLLSGGLRKRNVAHENLRLMARLPHALTWVEFHYREYWEHLIAKRTYTILFKDRPQPTKVGWLLEQHPKNNAAFRAIEIWAGVSSDGRVAYMQPISATWCSDDSRSPYWPIFNVETSEAVVGEGYHSTQAFWTSTFENNEVSVKMTEDRCRGLSGAERDFACKPMVPTRVLWGLLATINDLPVTIEHVEPSKGFIARGNYKKFLKHSIVHLNVPETRWRKLVAKTAAALRRRAHQVRNHWRKDWRNPPSPRCEHRWASVDGNLVCQRCQGRTLFIAEHARGDSSLGYVLHDYEVHHDTRS